MPYYRGSTAQRHRILPTALVVHSNPVFDSLVWQRLTLIKLANDWCQGISPQVLFPLAVTP